MRFRTSLQLLVLAGAVALFAAACAPRRPVLYPNEVVQQVGWSGAARDVEECLEFAASYGLEPRPAARAAGSTVVASGVGAAMGGAAGAVRGDPGRRAGAGAAAGAAAGALRGLLHWRDPDPMQRRFVQICLANRGYQVIGWR